MLRVLPPLVRYAPRASMAAAGTVVKPLLRMQPRWLQPNPSTAVRRLSSRPPPEQREEEKKASQKILEPRPNQVSAKSSVRHVFEESQSSGGGDPNPGGGLKHDIGIVKDSFRLSKVPRESHILGLAGTLPYMATSLSTVFLAWDLNKEIPTGNVLYDAVFINHDTARYLLDLIEPIQLGYGAIIISFLGAIHWGLEYAEKAPERHRTRFRYGMGVVASAVAWPTLFMPFEYALTAQFMAFIALYFADSRAAARGWAPSWYGMYRFLLTAMVGFAILISLVVRASISQHARLSTQGLSSTMTAPGIADHSTNWAKLEAEEKARIKKEKEKKEREQMRAEKPEDEKNSTKEDAKNSKQKDKRQQNKDAAKE
ncbi:hypothetical protein CDD81_7978 [Ophiocordyceps australis]|uniref:Mitochondrial inner membrane protein 1 n=1 Tax=Ophiocordyceps australis TaxID=1399860 RepID=A0A2C5XZ94_9HYPO|nr:hypothetical protein CDD81_7978 [Ophiocordyceps australis]